jgi:eukaryotic-like serine/threonine-protein kinase
MVAAGTVLQGRYRVLEQIGRGGMGAVYRATDLNLRRDVALKQLLRDDPQERKAFEREALLLARLSHRSLPVVFDHLSVAEGQFLVMEYIAGDDFDKLLVERGDRFRQPAALRDVLRWAEELLDVLEYLHSQKPPIVHLDIKPRNLKLRPQNTIVLLDFGLARGGRITTQTQGGESTTPPPKSLRGFTAAYAPLEQLRMGDPDPRSDLYALATTLSHMLTGAPPPDAHTRALAFYAYRPDPLRDRLRFPAHVPAAVAELLYTAMSLEADPRPPSAAVMRQALRQAQLLPLPQPSQPRPPLQTPQLRSPRSTTPARAVLHQALPVGSPISSVAFSPTGEQFAAGSEDHAINIWHADGSHLHDLRGHLGKIASLAFSLNGQILASASDDKTVRLWRTNDGALMYAIHPWPNSADSLECVAYGPDGRTLAVGGWSESVAVWSVSETQPQQQAHLSSTYAHSLAFAPDGQQLAVGCYDGAVVVWSVQERKVLRELRAHSTQVLCLAFSPDGHYLAAGGENDSIAIWRTRDWRLMLTLREHEAPVRSIAFTPDSQVLISGSEDGTVRLFNTRDGSSLGLRLDHPAGVTGVALSPDGQTLVSGSHDSRVRVWELHAA